MGKKKNLWILIGIFNCPQQLVNSVSLTKSKWTFYCWTLEIFLFCSIIEKGEENCGHLIEAHKECMRALGFKIWVRWAGLSGVSTAFRTSASEVPWHLSWCHCKAQSSVRNGVALMREKAEQSSLTLQPTLLSCEGGGALGSTQPLVSHSSAVENGAASVVC